MESKQQAQLEQAKAFFYAQKIAECYGILRRYFDRLPFKPEIGHSEYIGMFCRVLSEMGKDFELNFYVNELEKLSERVNDPNVNFALAVAYIYSNQPRNETAKELLERVCKDSSCPKLQAKSKMWIAHLYSTKDDYTSARAVIEGVQPSGDLQIDRLATIWRANVARAIGRPEDGLAMLSRILEEVTEQEDWYVYFSARNVAVLILATLEKEKEAEALLDELRTFVDSKNFKSTREQLKSVEEKIKKRSMLGKVTFEPGTFKSAFIYGKKRTFITGSSPVEKLLGMFLKKGFLDKGQIVKAVYGRAYKPEDDKLVYYHIHSLRQKLKEMGVPCDAVSTEDDGYRFVPEVEILGGDL
jgi:hypothetical protein